MNIVWDNNIFEYIQIQFKIKLSNGLYFSISYLQTVNKNDYANLLDNFIEFWNIPPKDIYKLYKVSSIVYSYRIISPSDPHGEGSLLRDRTSQISKHKRIISSEGKKILLNLGI